MNDLDECCDRLAGRLLGYARVLCGRDEATALDLVQETFLAWLDRPRRADVRDLDSYLFATLRNRWLNWTRSRRRRQEHERASADRPALFAPDPAGPPAAEELEAALGRLPEAQREAVFLKIWGALTFEQIGTATGAPTKTAASRYAAGLAKLRSLLEDRP